MSLKGVSTILITPFNGNGRIDIESLKNLVEFHLNVGVHGLTILGIMAEPQKLTEAERKLIITTVVEVVKGKIPITVGCTANGTDLVIHYARMAKELGAHAIMVAPPANLKNYETIFQHYAAIGESVDIPIVIQDEPLTTNVIMPAAFQADMARKIKNVQYCKLEETPSPQKISSLLKKSNGSLKIFGGLGGMYFYEELLRGAVGIMTGFAFPEILVAIYNAFINGNQDKAREIFYKYLPLIRFEAQLGIGGVTIRKEILKERGIIKSSYVRSPAVKVDSETLEEMRDLIKYLKLDRDNIVVNSL